MPRATTTSGGMNLSHATQADLVRASLLRDHRMFADSHGPRPRPAVRDCPKCNGTGELHVGGDSLNPFSGIRVLDPQLDDYVTCDRCRGAGTIEAGRAAA